MEYIVAEEDIAFEKNIVVEKDTEEVIESEERHIVFEYIVVDFRDYYFWNFDFFLYIILHIMNITIIEIRPDKKKSKVTSKINVEFVIPETVTNILKFEIL